MKLTRHARNRSRLYAIAQHEVELIARHGRSLAPDRRGNQRVEGPTADGRLFVVVVALDNPDLVITLIKRRAR